MIAIDVHYVPSAEPQQLDILFQLDAKKRAHTHPMHEARLYAQTWVDLINAGLAAGDAFDPARSSAKVVKELAAMPRTGVHAQTLSLEVRGVAPQFLRVIALAFVQARFGSSLQVLHGVHADFAVRALTIRGSRPGESVIDGATLQAWLDDPTIQLGAFAGESPFELAIAQGPKALLKIVAKAALTAETFATIENAVKAWLQMSLVWPRGPADPLGVALRPLGHNPFLGFAGFKGGATLDWELGTVSGVPFSFAPAPVDAALRSAMRALHARVPLEKVVLTLPAPEQARDESFPFPFFGHSLLGTGSDGAYWVVRFEAAPKATDRVALAKALLPALSGAMHVQDPDMPWRWEGAQLVMCAAERGGAPDEASEEAFAAIEAIDRALVAVHAKWPIAEVFAMSGESASGSEWDRWSRLDGRKPSFKGLAVFRKGKPDPKVEAIRASPEPKPKPKPKAKPKKPAR